MKKIKQHKLLVDQLDKKLQSFEALRGTAIPAAGWINAIRTALKMSLRQMGNRLSITPQSMKETEQREKDGSITLKNLREAGRALDMQLVYGFIPKEESLEKMIEKKAYDIAREIVKRTSHSMMLEDQENSKQRIEKAIKERAEEIKNEMPGYLWD
ncbi:MAG TPA: mobile mystery protein A [Chitinophagaceae bacterium]|nr:mobile mystery protein A [Chitinophagaceae bacterium]